MFTIEVQNLDDVLEMLRHVDSHVAEETKANIKEIAKPTLSKAKGYAAGLGVMPTGTYAASLSLKTYQNGVKFVSNDEGGGVIEFAHVGALILSGPRKGRTAGVPLGSEPPRALLRAILEDEESIVQQVNQTVQEVCDWPIGT